MAGSVMLYFGVRGYTHANTDIAAHHAHDIVTWERDIGIYIEPSMQDLWTDDRPSTTIMNWIYIWGHWPVIVVTLLWLVLDRHRGAYRVIPQRHDRLGAIGSVRVCALPGGPAATC